MTRGFGLILPLVACMASLAAPLRGQESRPPFRKPQFIRGDSNGDRQIDIADPIHTLFFLFSSGGEPPCLAAADSNGDRALDLSDAVATLTFLFTDPRPLPAPGPFACGVDPQEGGLPCAAYPHCPDDYRLVAHVLGRVTAGATEELYRSIQTRADLVRYLEEQLAAPADYDPRVHEPELHARVEGLGIGHDRGGSGADQVARLKASTLVAALGSRWQLLQVVAQFWNNHFHTQVDALRENFFGRGGRGGAALPATEPIFRLADASGDGFLTQAEWEAFVALHPALIPWSDFRRQIGDDGMLSLQEFMARNQIAFWKYGQGPSQIGIAGEMELREARFFQRRAFGTFGELLAGSAKGVAMLIYLNSFENTARAPNENYAREILELHALGADQGYTQRDIEQLAKLLTGWTVGWVERAPFDAASDPQYLGHPELRSLPINLREPRPVPAPTMQFWDDDLYTWAFVIELPAHDWGRKDIFLAQYGATDSLGNPLPAGNAVQVAENTGNRTVNAVLGEWDRFFDRLTSLRDCRKFICSKLIQLFVTDELGDLARDGPAPPDVAAAFARVDADQDGAIDRAEWEEPVPLVLPNGRPPEKFDGLDLDADGRVTLREYREPDLLLAAMKRWEETSGDVREVVRAILFADEFLSLKFENAKVKTPLEQVTSTLRILNATATDAQLKATALEMDLAGMDLYQFADPTGESEVGQDWMHTIGLLERIRWISRGVVPETQAQRRFAWSPAGFTGRYGLAGRDAFVDFFIGLIHPEGVLPEDRALARKTYDEAAVVRIDAMVNFLLTIAPAMKQ